MIKPILLFLFIVLIIGCRSVEKHNSGFSNLRSEEQLKSDVDYVHRKLEKFHPELYQFINKSALDHKFDSLKASITSPLSAKDFYLRLSPVIASVRQGHMRVFVPFKSSWEDRKSVSKLGYNPWFPFKTEMIGDSFYILRDNRKGSSTPVGTEITSINGCTILQILNEYKNTTSVDGYNESVISKRFPGMLNYFLRTSDTGGPAIYKVKYKDSIWTIDLKQKFLVPEKKSEASKTAISLPKQDKVKNISEREKTSAILSKSKTKSLKFHKGDSSIAIMQIDNFRKGSYEKFYAKSFHLLASSETKTLIIDLRNNGGGRLSDVKELYSYLVDTAFYFTAPLQITSRTSILRNASHLSTNYFLLPGPIHTALATLSTITPTILTNIGIKKAGPNAYSYPSKYSRLSRHKSDNYKGNVYVLINGTTFSASSILSANLKGSGRAVFVGAETGGGQNGCVAGFMPVITLPYSKLDLQFGLVAIHPHYLSDTVGRGIMPDAIILPTITDRLKKIDPELQWVLNDIKRR